MTREDECAVVIQKSAKKSQSVDKHSSKGIRRPSMIKTELAKPMKRAVDVGNEAGSSDSGSPMNATQSLQR